MQEEDSSVVMTVFALISIQTLKINKLMEVEKDDRNRGQVRCC